MPTAMNAIQKSPSNVRSELKRLGFFHATGLLWVEVTHDEEGEIQASHDDLGRWGHIGDWTFAVLENGEVWFVFGEADREIRDLLSNRKICPRGRGARNPFGNDHIDVTHILLYADHVASRIRDPYSAHYVDPTPRPR